MPKEKTTRHFTCAKCSRGQGWLWKKKEPQKVTFQKTIDLDKHLKEEHGSTMFKCTAIGCFRGASAPLFQKSETLTQHIKETHRPDTKYTCPAEDCTFAPSDLDTLAIHAYWTHISRPAEYHLRSGYSWKDALVRPAFNAATWQYFRCPVWNCGSLVSGQYDEVSAHPQADKSTSSWQQLAKRCFRFVTLAVSSLRLISIVFALHRVVRRASAIFAVVPVIARIKSTVG